MEDNHIPDQSVLSSSFHGGYYPYRGRLFSSTYPWMAATTDRNAFLQIAVGITDHVITAVATQGRKTYKTAVVKFQLSFSIDSLQWFDYREDGDVRVNMRFNVRTVHGQAWREKGKCLDRRLLGAFVSLCEVILMSSRSMRKLPSLKHLQRIRFWPTPTTMCNLQFSCFFCTMLCFTVSRRLYGRFLFTLCNTID